MIFITVQRWTPRLKDRQWRTSGVCSEDGRKDWERNGFQIPRGQLEGFGDLQPGEQEWLEWVGRSGNTVLEQLKGRCVNSGLNLSNPSWRGRSRWSELVSVQYDTLERRENHPDPAGGEQQRGTAVTWGYFWGWPLLWVGTGSDVSEHPFYSKADNTTTEAPSRREKRGWGGEGGTARWRWQIFLEDNSCSESLFFISSLMKNAVFMLLKNKRYWHQFYRPNFLFCFGQFKMFPPLDVEEDKVSQCVCVCVLEISPVVFHPLPSLMIFCYANLSLSPFYVWRTPIYLPSLKNLPSSLAQKETLTLFSSVAGG